MSVAEITLGIVLGLVVNEFSDVSPWLARKLVGWSARVRYGDTARAEIRAEELAAVINDRPGKLFKLGTGLRFASAALAESLRRTITGQSQPSDEPLPDDILDRARRRQVVLEDEPSVGVARYLFPTEKFRGEWRRHWMHPAKSVAMTILIAVLAVWAAELRIKPRYVGWTVALIVTVAVLFILLRLMNWWFTRFVITNKRLMSTEGMIGRRVAMMPLLRVTDMRYTQSRLGRLLNYGDFELESASRRNAMRRIVDLPNPNELYLRLVEEMYEPEAVEVRLARRPIDNDDWGLDLPLDPAESFVDEQFAAPESAMTAESVGVAHAARMDATDPLQPDELAPLYAAQRRRAPSPRPRPEPVDPSLPPLAPPPDPSALHRELLDQIGTLAGHLTALTAAITRLATPGEPSLVTDPPGHDEVEAG